MRASIDGRDVGLSGEGLVSTLALTFYFAYEDFSGRLFLFACEALSSKTRTLHVLLLLLLLLLLRSILKLWPGAPRPLPLSNHSGSRGNFFNNSP